ncbi:MAG: OmpA family protein [Tahibacter sp.]
MNARSRWLLSLSAVLFSAGAHAQYGFPDTVKFPAQVVINPDQAMDQKDIDEAEFESGAEQGVTQVRRGRHYTRWLTYKPATGEPANGYYNGSETRVWNSVSASLLPLGWKVVFSSEDHSYTVLHLSANGHDDWARLTMDAPQSAVKFELIEVSTTGVALTLKAPAATPEKFGAHDDIPYLTPFPGSQPINAGGGEGPLDISIPNSTNDEPQLVGSRTLIRSYQAPSTLSQLAFVAGYRAALTTAGWTVVFPANAKDDAGSARLIVHYARGSRDIWATLFYEFGAQISFTIADVGADDLARSLALDCHVPLYGVRFDFNKATLKPESDALLTRAATTLKTFAGKSVEVQGHTDNVGGDDVNLKLSETRATSVKNWLVHAGVDATRLSSKGYGKSQPVADNNSDQGRAKNRRVELFLPDCKH